MTIQEPLFRINCLERLAIINEIKQVLDDLYGKSSTSEPMPMTEQIKLLLRRCSQEELTEVLEWLNAEFEKELPW